MKIRALVAKTDGTPGRDGNAFAPGSIKPATGLPVTRNFDPRLPPIGLASITIEGTDVYAEIEIHSAVDAVSLSGAYPALGVRALDGVRAGSITDAELHEVSICLSPNTDPRIPPIA